VASQSERLAKIETDITWIRESLQNHLQHHVTIIGWWMMIAMVVVSSFIGPLSVSLILRSLAK
jgi:hypothetical protein